MNISWLFSFLSCRPFAHHKPWRKSPLISQQGLRSDTVVVVHCVYFVHFCFYLSPQTVAFWKQCLRPHNLGWKWQNYDSVEAVFKSSKGSLILLWAKIYICVSHVASRCCAVSLKNERKKKRIKWFSILFKPDNLERCVYTYCVFILKNLW